VNLPARPARSYRAACPSPPTVREFAGKARQAISSRVPQAAKDVIKNLTPGQKTAIMAMLGVGGVGAVVARKAMKPKSKRSKR